MSLPIDGQLEAFPAPLIGATLVAWYEPGRGWSVRAQQRREGGGFSPGVCYERMTRGELLDILLDVALDALELRD